MSIEQGTDEPEELRSLLIIREYGVLARILFTAWSTPEHLLQWFGPEGWPLTMCEVDFRVGGRWRFAMTGPDGVQNTPFGGQYLEIVPNRRIVFDNAFEIPGSPKMITSVTFEEHNGSTTLSHHTLFESIAMHDEYLGLGFTEGTGSGLDKLATVVTALRRDELGLC